MPFFGSTLRIMCATNCGWIGSASGFSTACSSASNSARALATSTQGLRASLLPARSARPWMKLADEPVTPIVTGNTMPIWPGAAL